MKHILLFENYHNNRNFDTWFGESKMTENGKPKVYYHGVGRAGKFNKFRKDLLGSSSGNLGHYGEGFYFAPSYKEAKMWSESMGGTSEVLEVYLKIENPFVVTRENLLNIGEKYDLNIPSKKSVSIDKDSLIDGLKNIDPISAEFLELISKEGYKKAWKIFIDNGKVDKAKLDLNDVSDWSEYLEDDEYRGVNDYIIDELKELGIEPKINYDYPDSIAMHYLTNVGQTASEWSNAIKAEGYDGIDAGSEIVVFEPNQIKSIENNGSFSTTNDNIYESLNEGLTKSYDSEKVIKHIVNHTPINKEDIWTSDTQNGTEKINIDFKLDTVKYAEKIVNTIKNVYGWYLAKTRYDFFDEEYFPEEIIDMDYTVLEEVLADEDDSIMFTFERKYDKEYTGTDTTLYHITDEKYLNRIMRVGLVPKAKHKISVHPERVYLMLTRKEIDTLYDNPSIDIEDPVILEVDISNLDLKLYYDPNMPQAVYTLSNIPPKNIKVITE